MKRFAHSVPNLSDETRWEPLGDHLHEVAGMARRFGEPLGLAVWAELAGLLHDIGKASDAYQLYIRGKGSSPVNGGVKVGHCGGAKVGQLDRAQGIAWRA